MNTRVISLATAVFLAALQDPAVKAGGLRLEFYPWFAARNIKVTAQAKAPVPAR